MNQTQREIKFKLRLRNQRKMMDWGEIKDMMPLALYQHKKGDATLLQYTGLKDKNGKEIYDGDIILGKFDVNTVEDYIYLGLSDLEIKDLEKKFVIEDIFFPYENPLPDDITVLGNVYESPELMSD